MKRLKKAALAVACAAVLCSVFSGCGGDKKDTAKAAPAEEKVLTVYTCLLYTSPSPRDTR